jgi:tRNA pseudouridine13 synthase
VSPALPFVTADRPGSGGRLKCSPEDFQVDERPAYLPGGSGPHLYLHVEKRGLTTRDAVRWLARALGVGERDVGYAGLKDKAAVTTQWLSFPVTRDPDPAGLATEGLRVLAASRHQNKLRVGHSRGNAFQVVVRSGQLAAAAACAARLRETGLPNFFGPQRFGSGGANAAL